MQLSCTHRYCVAKLGINGEKGLYIYVKILSIYDIMLIFARKWGTGMGFKCLRLPQGNFHGNGREDFLFCLRRHRQKAFTVIRVAQRHATASAPSRTQWD